MKNKIIVILFLVVFKLNAQVGINTTTPNAQLEIKSSNQATPSNTDGIIIPKIDAFPATNPTAAQQGMMVYLTTPSAGKQPGFYYWDNGTSGWITINSSVNGDTDWLKSTGGGTPNNTDDMYHSGRVAIGNTPTPIKSLHINGHGIYNQVAGQSEGIVNSVDTSVGGNVFGTYTNMYGNGLGAIAGNYIKIANTNNNSEHNGIWIDMNNVNTLNNNRNGIRTDISGTANVGWHVGMSNNIQSNFSTFGRKVGVLNNIGGTGENYGISNSFSTGTNGFGMYNGFSGTVPGTGIFNSMQSTTSGTQYGMYNNYNGLSTGTNYGSYNGLFAGSGTEYGTYNDIQNNTNGVKYGTYNRFSSTGTGAKYGTYNDFSGAVNYPLYGSYTNINTTSNTAQLYGNYINISGIASNPRIGNQVSLSGIGTGQQIANQNTISYTGNSERNGIVNTFSGNTTSNSIGFSNTFNDSSSSTVGFFNQFNSLGNSTTYGFYNFENGTSTGTQYGLYNSFSFNSTGELYGIRNLLNRNSINSVYGTSSVIIQNGSGNVFGNEISIGGNGTGVQYGCYINNGTNMAATGTKYGVYATISNNSGGIHYGIYSDVQKFGCFAGYFLGRVSIGTTSANNYILPASRGTNGQIMQSDASGNVSWITPTYGSINNFTTATAGIYNITSTDYTIRVTNSVNIINLPNAATNTGKIYILIGANGISAKTITSSGGNMYNDTTGTNITTLNSGAKRMIQSDGTNWIVLN